jgi:hypothetical protein
MRISGKMKNAVGPLPSRVFPVAQVRPRGAALNDRGAFTFRGHRLASLYRGTVMPEQA